jgi:hypothetical protein
LEVPTEHVGLRDGIEIAVEPQDVQDGGIGADRHADAARFDVPQRRHRHTGALRDELRRQTAPEPSGTNPPTEAGERPLKRRE